MRALIPAAARGGYPVVRSPSLVAWVIVLAVLVAALVPSGLDRNLATDLARYGIDGQLARRLLPRRENRLHRQPDGAGRRRLRAAGRRPAADGAARRDDGGDDAHDGARRRARSRCAPFEFSLDPGHRRGRGARDGSTAARLALDGDDAERHAHRGARRSTSRRRCR